MGILLMRRFNEEHGLEGRATMALAEGTCVATILETPRLVLMELSLDDLDFIATMMSDPHVMRFYPKRLNRDEAAASIRRMLDRYARDGFGPWLVRETSSGRPVGRVGLIRQHLDGVPEIEVAWMIHRPYQRCGFASEAGRACAAHALNALEAKRVISLIRPENLPSIATALKLGMTCTRDTLHAGYHHRVYETASALAQGRISGCLS
jgi:RimJ/RimL family protein N-acetyltransferase